MFNLRHKCYVLKKKKVIKSWAAGAVQISAGNSFIVFCAGRTWAGDQLKCIHEC